MQERAWSIARTPSGTDAVSAAAAAAGKRPALKIIPSGNMAPPGHRRVWVRKRGTSHATSVVVDQDELVDDLKTKVLNRFPTTLLCSCDPADLTFALSEELTKQFKAVSPGNSATRKRAPSHGQGQVEPHQGQWSSPTVSSISSEARTTPSTTPGASSALTPGAWPAIGSTTPGRGIELSPDEPIVPIIDRFFPQGMTIADAFEVYPVEQSQMTSVPAMPIPPRNFKFKTNPPPPIQRPAVSRGNSVEKGQSTPQTTTPNTTTAPSHPPSRSASKSRSTSQTRGRSRERAISRSTSKKEENPPTQPKDTGVLLLPRQFRMAEDRIHKEEGDDTGDGFLGAPSKGNTVASPQVDLTPKSDISTNRPPENADDNSDVNVTLTHLRPNNSTGNDKVIVPQINVLIVEDNVINQKILEAFMRRKSVCYAIAKNGKEAVSKWRQGGFHLILMDIQLPVMTGLEATKEIRRLEYKNRIGAISHAEADHTVKSAEDELTGTFKSPVIIVALTASSASKDKSEALAAGCNDFLTKPVNLTWLEQKIVEWGCMQALIDFDGWRQWIRKSLDEPENSASPVAPITNAPQKA